jgi:hypothetical protein
MKTIMIKLFFLEHNTNKEKKISIQKQEKKLEFVYLFVTDFQSSKNRSALNLTREKVAQKIHKNYRRFREN